MIPVTMDDVTDRGRPHTSKYDEIDFWLLYEARQQLQRNPSKTVTGVIREVARETWKAYGHLRGASQEAIQARLFRRIRPTIIRSGNAVLVKFDRPEFDFFVSPFGDAIQQRTPQPGRKIGPGRRRGDFK
jgi:hypothetical protein